MIRFIHAADLHLGLTTHGDTDPETGWNTRFVSALARLQDCAAYARAGKFDAFLFAGDVFHGASPDATALREFARVIERLAREMPVVIVIGNHDSPASGRKSHALGVLDAVGVPNLFVVDRPGLIRLETQHGPLHVAALPWPNVKAFSGPDGAPGQAMLGAFVERVLQGLELEAAATPAVPAVLLAHIAVAEAQLSGGQSYLLGRGFSLPLATLKPLMKTFRYTALGHIHKTQGWEGLGGPLEIRRPICYAGSMDRLDFGEEDDMKGWLNVTVPDDPQEPTLYGFCTGLATQSTRFTTVELDVRGQPDPNSVAAAAVAGDPDIAGAIVRVRAKLDPEQETRFDYYGLLQKHLLGRAAHVAPLVRLIERPPRVRLGDPRFISEASTEQILERYFVLSGVAPDRRATLMEAAQRIMSAVDANE